MHLRYVFNFVSIITTSKDEKDTSFTVFIAINGQGLRQSRPFVSHFVGMGIGTHQQYIKALCEKRRLNNQLHCSMAILSE